MARVRTQIYLAPCQKKGLAANTKSHTAFMGETATLRASAAAS